jgi:hypothetical protein
VARAIFGIIFENQGVFFKIHGTRLDYKETKGPLCKMAGIFWFCIYFSIGNRMDQVHGSWTSVGAVHGGHRTEAAMVAHRSSCSWSVRATAARHEVGKMKESSPGFGSDLHQSLYGGKEATRRRWSFDSGWRRCGTMRTRRGRVRGWGSSLGAGRPFIGRR